MAETETTYSANNKAKRQNQQLYIKGFLLKEY